MRAKQATAGVRSGGTSNLTNRKTYATIALLSQQQRVYIPTRQKAKRKNMRIYRQGFPQGMSCLFALPENLQGGDNAARLRRKNKPLS
jgi:hypothetical protein